MEIPIEENDILAITISSANAEASALYNQTIPVISDQQQ